MKNDIYNGNHPALWNKEQQESFITKATEMFPEIVESFKSFLTSVGMLDNQNLIMEFEYKGFSAKMVEVLEATGLNYVGV